MRKATAILTVMMMMCSAGLWAQSRLDQLFAQADQLYDQEKHQQAGEVLKEAEPLVSTDSEKAGLYWRQSRNVLSLADEAEREGEMDESGLLVEYERGEALAQKAIELDSSDHNGYYWHASNLGRWGQTKGILNSLMKASPMRDDLEIAVRKDPEHADSFYVLGQLYASVPKMISFGNVEYAVSYDRRALDVYDGDKTKYSYYLKLGEHLQQRDWDNRKRTKEVRKMEDDYRDASDPAEKYKYYEAAFNFSASQPYSPGGVEGMSDHEEALKIVSWIVDELGSKANLSSSERDQLKDARQNLDDWK